MVFMLSGPSFYPLPTNTSYFSDMSVHPDWLMTNRAEDVGGLTRWDLDDDDIDDLCIPDQVPECSNAIVIDEEGGEFQCPRKSQPGIFTKHAHPEDCR